jgi:hypothetical protein
MGAQVSGERQDWGAQVSDDEPRSSVSGHLSREQVEGYVDRSIGPLERQKILAHTSGCLTCAGKLRSMEVLRKQNDAASLPGSRRITTLWGRPDLVAAAASIVLAVGVSGIWLWQQRSDTPSQNVLALDTHPGTGDAQPASVHMDPVGVWVRETTPLLQWSAVPGATRYTVELFDDQLTLIQRSPSLQATRWRTDAVLEQGHVYFWQVTATLADGKVVNFPRAPAPEARFGVLESGPAPAGAR